MAMKVIRDTFGRMPDGREVLKFTLSNSNGLSAVATTYGATLISFKAPDRAGKVEEVTLNYDTLDGVRTGDAYYGATCGRVANRIAGGKFTLEDTERTLAVNNGPNALHGGLAGFDKVLWDAEPIEKSDHVGVKFTYQSADGEEGYPGNLSVSVQMLLSEQDNLEFVYSATTDQATPVNLTNHTYWNLADGGKSSVLGHEIELPADFYTPVDATSIPTGEVRAVGGAMDLRKRGRFGAGVKEADNGMGYDHNYVLRAPSAADGLRPVARVWEPSSGRWMAVRTDQPGVQLYTGNYLDHAGRGGTFYGKHHGFCLETQRFPDSVNKPHFPSAILRPGEVYTHTTVHEFGASSTAPKGAF